MSKLGLISLVTGSLIGGLLTIGVANAADSLLLKSINDEQIQRLAQEQEELRIQNELRNKVRVDAASDSQQQRFQLREREQVQQRQQAQQGKRSGAISGGAPAFGGAGAGHGMGGGGGGGRR